MIIDLNFYIQNTFYDGNFRSSYYILRITYPEVGETSETVGAPQKTSHPTSTFPPCSRPLSGPHPASGLSFLGWCPECPPISFSVCLSLSMAVFIIFPKSRNTFQNPLSKRVCKRLSRVVAFIIEIYREYQSRGRHCHCAAAWRSLTRRMSRDAFIISIYRNVFLAQTRIRSHFFPAFQKGVSNPLIKTALRLSSEKITLKVVWKP